MLALIMTTSLFFHHGLYRECRNDCLSAELLVDFKRRRRNLRTLYWARNLFEVLH